MNDLWNTLLQWLHRVGLHPDRAEVERAGAAVLDSATGVQGPAELWLGPEPLIGPQQVMIVSCAHPDRAVRVATDGLRPFTAEALQ